MKLRVLWLAILVCATGGPAICQAAEPYLEFVRALRSRGYYDYAVQYLDQIAAASGTPADIRRVVPYEKAITLVQGTRIVRNPDMQRRQLDEAEALLEQFVKANPNDPRIAKARSERARILLGKAKIEIWQVKSPANKGSEAEFRKRALGLITRARAVFQKAHDSYEAAYKKMDTYIPPTETARIAVRHQLETDYIRAQIDLALCSYWQAQCYDPKDPRFKSTLTKAAVEFSKIHDRHRSQMGGFYARIWQGKCFEEQDELRKALGIYNEILGHQGNVDSMQTLQDQARHFRLICLNNPKRHDYQLVVQEVAEWLKSRRTRRNTTRGLGIRWQRAVALEKLGTDRNSPENVRNRYLRQALVEAMAINRFPGQYKDVSTFMIRRLKVALHGKTLDPRDFDTAFGIARTMVKEIKGFQDKIQAARTARKPAGDIAKLESDLELHLNETARLFRLALELRETSTPPRDVNRARFLMGLVDFYRDRLYDAAVPGEFVGRHFVSDDPQMALESTHLAFAAYQKRYNQLLRSRQNNDFEMAGMIRLGNWLVGHWPASERANDARMTLGQLYAFKQQPAEAAKWYSQVPRTSPQYAEAQLDAGQAYWSAYLQAAPKPAEEKPPAEELSRWAKAAEEHLRRGIGILSKSTPAKSAAPPGLTAAKVSLAQIVIHTGDYKSAIGLLTAEPHSVLRAVVVPDENKRPSKGVLSREFAGLAYQLLLRAYVGTQQIDAALKTMTQLEKIAGGAGSESVLEIYKQLGEELKKEIERLSGLGQSDRLSEVRTSFETFLSELFKRRDSMNYGQLIWIAETYTGLGDGLRETDPSAAQPYFQKAAAAYQTILNRSQADASGQFMDKKRLPGVRLRLVNCRRNQGDYSAALDMVAEVLKEHPSALDAQFEAAYVLQDWGASGQAGAAKQLLKAINGDTGGPQQKRAIWGWVLIARRLRPVLDNPQQSKRYRDKFFEARYNISWCRRQYGLAQSATPKRRAGLEAAMQELSSFAVVVQNVPDPWWSKFDRLYRQIQKDLKPGEPAKPLARPKPIVMVAAGSRPNTKSAGKSAGTKTSGRRKSTGNRNSAARSAGLSPAVYIVIGLLGLGGLVWMVLALKNQNRKRQPAYSMISNTRTASTSRPKPSGSSSSTAREPRKQSSTTQTKRSAGDRPPSGGSKPPANPDSRKRNRS